MVEKLNLNELDTEMDELESKFEDFTQSLREFKVKSRNYIKKNGSDSSEMWVYHLSNMLDELDDMVTELANFGEVNNLF